MRRPLRKAGSNGGKAAAWTPAGARTAASAWPLAAAWPAGRLVSPLARWLAIEAGPGRLVLWLPVAFGAGVVLYFSASREPVWWAPLALLFLCTVVAMALRARPLPFTLAVLGAAAAAGYAAVTLKTAALAHPVLAAPAFGVALTGWVEAREERERTDRITLAVHTLEGRRVDPAPDRVRVSVRKGTAPPVGSFVALKARLSPPLGPLRPGGYDFARDLYFQGIGASGFAQGAITTLLPPETPRAGLRYLAYIAAIRDGIDARIRAALPGDAGAIASALITGKRDAISAPVNEAMYASSLAHVLSISGYHMALVAGVVFFVVRALLAASSTLAMRWPIKKWAACAALLAATGYLAISGAEVATQRSYLMTAVVLLGVLVDRAALTLRTLAIAAIAVLLWSPQAVVHPSFQMSFAATLALVAAYEHGLPWTAREPATTMGARLALWGGREIASLVFASLVAGLATTLYAAFHFHRIAPYGTLANLLAMPIVSIWVMPMGLLALLAAPFGFDDRLWTWMGQGIEWMIAVALWVAELPGAVGRVPAFSVGALLLGTAALLLLCLLRSPLRWGGLAAAALAVALAARTEAPDVLVAPGAQAVAVRTPTGGLAALKLGNDTFAIREWLAADADDTAVGDPDLRKAFTCDEAGCLARLPDGALVAVPQRAAAFEEDCLRAALIVTRRSAPPGCAAPVVGRTTVLHTGAVALFRTPGGFRSETARPRGYDRPWAPDPAAPAGAATPDAVGPQRPTPDATPAADDLGADD